MGSGNSKKKPSGSQPSSAAAPQKKAAGADATTTTSPPAPQAQGGSRPPPKQSASPTFKKKSATSQLPSLPLEPDSPTKTAAAAASSPLAPQADAQASTTVVKQTESGSEATNRTLLLRAEALAASKGKPWPPHLVAAALHGRWDETQKLAAPKRLVRLFTSSTFDDTRDWRDALMAKIYPFLQDLCSVLGLEFAVVDMRWGVRETTGNDHGTSELCMWELRKCKELSLGPAFVTFLGDRYGYRPFPKEIPKADFEILLQAVQDSAAKELLNKWFLLDENRVPPVYILQPVSTFYPDFINSDRALQGAASKQWWPVFETMQAALRTASAALPDSNETKPLLTISVTNEEVLRGIMHADEKARQSSCYAYLRGVKEIEDWMKDPEFKQHPDFPQRRRICDCLPSGEIDLEARQLLAQVKDEVASLLPAVRTALARLLKNVGVVD